MSPARNLDILRGLQNTTLGKSGKLFPLVLVILASCSPSPTEDMGPIPLLTQGVYVLNEGVPGQANSTLTYFVPDSNKVNQDVFRAVNGRTLGDTGGEIVVSGTFAYIVMTGSDKIEVIRIADNVSVGTILLKAGSNPFSLAVTGTKGYVTNRTRNGSVTVLNLTNNTVLLDSVAVGPYPEGITAIAGKVYVCNSNQGSGRTVSVIDATTDRVLRSITVGIGPSCADVTSDGYVWILCTGAFGGSGNTGGETPGNVFVIDPYFDTVVDSVFVGGHPSSMAISLDGFAYVVEGNRVLKYNTRVDQLITSGFIVGSVTSNFYGIAVDDYTNSIYVADAKDFVQNGEVRIYTSDGFLSSRFDAGVAPVSIAFRR